MRIKLIDPRAVLPTYGSQMAAGADLHAVERHILLPHSVVRVGTGIAIQLPVGYEAQIRPRSGLAYKHHITVLNTPGTIDEDYRGEVCVILVNHSDEAYTIEPGDRIAQMVIKKYEQFEFEVVEELGETVRGSGGFGSTGA